ncbi:MAG: TonB-dependent receptor [Porphyromonadaceae bacterium]|nr:TonB-dependent receptor [Porphyromonadaceae bacterium]
MHIKLLVGLACCSSLTLLGQNPEAQADTIRQLQEVVVQSRQILGSKFQAQNRTGSAYYISPGEIKKLGYTDINRMLKSVPGVNMYEEDGFGLRPNISLRGTKAERSERITIMEDGILAAPAPYSSPAAYYFPNAARMHAVEVLKGSSQVQYGPFTTGGAINMVSTPIPAKLDAKLALSYGSHGTLKAHAMVGNSHRYYGYMVEYLRMQSNGFKRYADRHGDGLERNDILAKFRVNTDNNSGANHALELKFGYANEHSDETYVGLTELDFERTPYLRYAGSAVDNIKTKHQQWVATYLFKLRNTLQITANAYYNYFHRNWYKLNDVRAGVTSGEVRSLASVLAEPEINSAYYDILTGQTDYLGAGLIVRANNRSYHASGLQAKAEYKQRIGRVYTTLEAGVRYHVDMEDRYQWDDAYSMQQGKMHLYLPGIHGAQSNRITSARALASHLLAKIAYKSLTVTTGLRYEDIALNRNDMGKRDPRRTGMRRHELGNTARVLIPSIGANLRLLRGASIFMGVHKGFAPPGVTDIPRVVPHRSLIPEGGFQQQKPEESVNVELGARYALGDLHVELIGFRNDYSNMLGSDLAAAGGLGTLEQFNIGKAIVQGAEFMLRYQPLPKSWKVGLPMQLSYTYTDTEMRNVFVSNSWGKVDIGDEIPYIYKHALNVRLGLEHKWGELHVSCRYNADMRTKPGQGSIAKQDLVPEHIIWDASAQIHLHRRVSLTANAINLLNTPYLTSRHPSGLRPGHPFGVYFGVNARL